jgi:Na+-transporting NADH:ubiquinone oxidoreductase subunit F
VEINNVGKPISILINRGKRRIKTFSDQTLKTALDNVGLVLPSICGGKGFCGACKLKVLNYKDDLTEREIKKLSENEKQTNTRLACQVNLTKDIEIELNEDFFDVETFEGTVVSNKNVTYDIKELKLDLDKPISFKSGQFMQFNIPKYDGSNTPVERTYSIASSELDKNRIEFLIRKVDSGIGSTYIHEKLKPGDKIILTGPYGDFYLRKSDLDIIFVAGGSGMAPIKSILINILENEIRHRKIWFFFGAKTENDLYYLDFYKKLEKKIPEFKFIPSVSEPTPGWTGEKGRFINTITKYLSNELAKSEKECYLCGSPGMLNACCELFYSYNISPSNIFYDSF